jgi:hypothetical protein
VMPTQIPGNAFWTGLMKAKPAKPGEIYGVPGQGDSLKISAFVIAALIFFWWLVTYAGLIKPLFLPSPMGVINALVTMLRDGFHGCQLLGTYLGQHAAGFWSILARLRDRDTAGNCNGDEPDCTRYF